MTNQFHVIYTSAHGPLLISFETNEERDAWCELQDDTFESFFAVDGVVSNVFSPVIGPEMFERYYQHHLNSLPSGKQA